MRGILVDRGLVYYRVYFRGKQIQKCFGRAEYGNSFRAAVRALKQLRQDLRAQKLLAKPARRATVSEGVRLFFDRYTAAPTVHPYRKKIAAYLAPVERHFGQRFLDTLTPEDILNYRQAREAVMSQSTVNSEHIFIRRMYEALMKWILAGQIAPLALPARNPAQVVTIPWLKEADKGRRLTREQLKTILESASPELREVILAGIRTGRRLHDLLGALWMGYGVFRVQWPVALQKAGVKDFRFSYLKRLAALAREIYPEGGNPGVESKAPSLETPASQRSLGGA
ncbi:MAG: hypothetical protein IPP35_03960 [Elusimicrobia bacterium]|nr:hypothetical protein [Elusimicrobiota bacterium]